jgi:hypothetical protein
MSVAAAPKIGFAAAVCFEGEGEKRVVDKPRDREYKFRLAALTELLGSSPLRAALFSF